MEGMWDEGWRSVCLPLDTQITLRGGNSWPLPKTTSYSRGFDAKCPGYPCWAQLWMESLPSCRKKNLLPGLLQFKGATISSSGASAPAQGSALGRQGFQVDYLIYPVAEGALALVHKHINISGCCQEWWQLMGHLSCSTFNGCSSKVGSLCICFFSPLSDGQTWTLEVLRACELPCCFAGTSADIPYCTWEVFNTSKLYYQLHMYWTHPITTNTLKLVLEIMGIFLK